MLSNMPTPFYIAIYKTYKKEFQEGIDTSHLTPAGHPRNEIPAFMEGYNSVTANHFFEEDIHCPYPDHSEERSQFRMGITLAGVHALEKHNWQPIETWDLRAVPDCSLPTKETTDKKAKGLFH